MFCGMLRSIAAGRERRGGSGGEGATGGVGDCIVGNLVDDGADEL